MEQGEILVMAGSRAGWFGRIAGHPGCGCRILNDLNSAIGCLRTGRYSDVVVDYARATTDVLEFLLNARDVAAGARVFVVGPVPAVARRQIGAGAPWVVFVNPDELCGILTAARAGNPAGAGKVCKEAGKVENDNR